MDSVWSFAKLYDKKTTDSLAACHHCKEQEILAVFSQRALNELHMAPGATLDVFKAGKVCPKLPPQQKSSHFPWDEYI